MAFVPLLDPGDGRVLSVGGWGQAFSNLPLRLDEGARARIDDSRDAKRTRLAGFEWRFHSAGAAILSLFDLAGLLVRDIFRYISSTSPNITKEMSPRPHKHFLEPSPCMS